MLHCNESTTATNSAGVACETIGASILLKLVKQISKKSINPLRPNRLLPFLFELNIDLMVLMDSNNMP